MKTGLFFGSFNPVHIGHLIIANHIAEYTDVDEVRFVVSPQNPLKSKEGLMDEDSRLEMVRQAIEGDKRFNLCDIEFSLPRPSYTIDTLKALNAKEPGKEWILIMGTDTLMTLTEWKEYEELLNNYQIYAYTRPNFAQGTELHPSIKIIPDVPLLDISATAIRDALKSGKSVRYLLPEKVNDYLKRIGLKRLSA